MRKKAIFGIFLFWLKYFSIGLLVCLVVWHCTKQNFPIIIIIFKKWANPGLFLFYFRSFLVTISIQIEKSVDGVLGIRTRGRRMVGADKTMELKFSCFAFSIFWIFLFRLKYFSIGLLVCLVVRHCAKQNFPVLPFLLELTNHDFSGS